MLLGPTVTMTQPLQRVTLRVGAASDRFTYSGFILLLTILTCSSITLTHALRAPHRREGVLNQRLTDEEYTARSLGTIQPQYLTQKLDHQDLADTRTFQQKYYINDTYWNPDNPIIFLFAGGEGPVSPVYVTDQWLPGVWSAQYGALQAVLEHRFYGESVPNNDSSTANLKYLSSAQYLEDLVTFHEHLTNYYNVTAKWIIFGGSYSGLIAAWAKLKYPNLFLGAIASSSPVQVQLDYSQYFQVVSTSIGPTCTSQIAAAQSVVNSLLIPPYTKLVDAFGLCAPMQNEKDVLNFLSDLSNPFAWAVQLNLDGGKTAWSIKKVCDLMNSHGTDPLAGLVAVWDAYNAYHHQTTCTDVSYANYIASMQPTSGFRSWNWQICSEFGYFQPNEGSNQPFSTNVTLAFLVDQCQDIFGITGLTPNVEWTNDFYGGNEIVTTNTVFTNGDIDPWHLLGNYQAYPTGSGLSTTLIHGTSHCADLYPPLATDPPALTAARLNTQSILNQWLAEGDQEEVIALQ